VVKTVAVIGNVVAAAAAAALGGQAAVMPVAARVPIGGAPAAARHLRALPGDPYASSAGQHHTAVEPSAFAAGETVVAAYQVGRHSGGGADNIAWGRSANSGRTWTGGVLPGITKRAGGRWDAASDPSVTYDARHHVWLIAVLDVIAQRGEGISVSRSTDDGRTWRRPSYVDRGTTYFYDKDWTVCDNHTASPFYGTCYLTWDDGITQQLFMQRSKDGGKHWTGPVKPAGSPIGNAGEPVVQPDGRVVVPYQATVVLSLVPPISLGIAIDSFSSLNGGLSWASPVKIADLHRRFFGLTYRAPGFPSVGVGGDGRVYVVWQDCQFEPGCAAEDLVMSTTKNGRRWSSLTRVPTGPRGSGRDSLTPAIAVDGSTGGPRTHVAITFYRDSHAGCAAPCTLSVLTVASHDGGKQWSRPRLLTSGIDTSWLAQTHFGPMTGDYIGETFTFGGSAVGVFAVAKPPTGRTLRERVVSSTQPVIGR
jgi:hypothetical protein